MTNQEYPKKLRILHIVSGDRWAGAEVMVYALLKELRKHHDVFAILLNPGDLAKHLHDIDVTTTILDESILNSWQIFKGIRRTLKEVDPDIVHTHRQKENVLGSIANLLSIRAKCVRTIHGDSEFQPIGIARLQVYIDNFCGQYLQQAIIAVSDDLRLKLITRFSPNKIVTVMNGIDAKEAILNLQTPDFKQAMPDKKHIGLVGRLDPVKRIDIFLETANFLLRNHADIPWHFHVFGEGRLEKVSKRLSETLGIAEKITFHGHRIDIKNCIYGLDAVIMTSDHEGLPITALESIAIGTPLIAHKVGGLIHLLQANPELLVSDHSASGYANAVTRVMRHSTPKMSYPEDYKIQNSYNQTLDLYCSLCARA